MTFINANQDLGPDTIPSCERCGDRLSVDDPRDGYKLWDTICPRCIREDKDMPTTTRKPKATPKKATPKKATGLRRKELARMAQAITDGKPVTKKKAKSDTKNGSPKKPRSAAKPKRSKKSTSRGSWDFFYRSESNTVHPKTLPAKCIRLEIDDDTTLVAALKHARKKGLPSGTHRTGCFEVQMSKGIWTHKEGNRIDMTTDRKAANVIFQSWKDLDKQG